jgi:hypothetical protein
VSEELKFEKSVLVGITTEGKPHINVEGKLTALESLGLVFFLETTLKESAERMLGMGYDNQTELLNNLGQSIQALQTGVQTSSYMTMQVVQTLQSFSEQFQLLLNQIVPVEENQETSTIITP